MLQQIRATWISFHASFHDSDTIVWARAQFVFLGIYTALQSVDMTLIVADKHLLQGYVFINAFITEMLRKRGEDWKTTTKVPADV